MMYSYHLWLAGALIFGEEHSKLTVLDTEILYLVR